jgi:hypothetical protein
MKSTRSLGRWISGCKVAHVTKKNDTLFCWYMMWSDSNKTVTPISLYKTFGSFYSLSSMTSGWIDPSGQLMIVVWHTRQIRFLVHLLYPSHLSPDPSYLCSHPQQLVPLWTCGSPHPGCPGRQPPLSLALIASTYPSCDLLLFLHAAKLLFLEWQRQWGGGNTMRYRSVPVLESSICRSRSRG